MKESALIAFHTVIGGSIDASMFVTKEIISYYLEVIMCAL